MLRYCTRQWSPSKLPIATPDIIKLPIATPDIIKLPIATPDIIKLPIATPDIIKLPIATPDIIKLPIATPDIIKLFRNNNRLLSDNINGRILKNVMSQYHINTRF